MTEATRPAPNRWGGMVLDRARKITVLAGPDARKAVAHGVLVTSGVEHGLLQQAREIARPFGFPIANS
jgi:hypothetical protein